MSRLMTDGHRRFLQTMMSIGVMESSKAKAMYPHFCGDQSSPAQMDDFISVINTQLQPMFMQIGKGMSEDDGLQYYALVNMAQTDITRMSSNYADNELELFRKTMDSIVDSETGTASSTYILNCADGLQTKKMKKKEVENVLDRLVQDKWLNEKRGEYTLSTHCIIEMEPYIRNVYQDLVKSCAMCHSLAFQVQASLSGDIQQHFLSRFLSKIHRRGGRRLIEHVKRMPLAFGDKIISLLQNQTCESCGIRMHLPCAAKYFKNHADPLCPSCKDYWPHEIPVFQSQSLSQSASTQANTAPAPTTSRRTRK